MNNTKRIGRLLLVVGGLMVCGALGLFIFNQWKDAQAGEAAKKVLPQVRGQIEEPSEPEPRYDDEMKEVMIGDYAYIGYLSIPALGLELPIMSQWDYPRLRIAPCRYSGSVKSEDLVLCAHNYARHFGNIKKLMPDDLVYFTDMDGTVSAYEVVSVDILEPTAVEDMTDSGYALTLFTCTYGGQSRVTVRCSRTE